MPTPTPTIIDQAEFQANLARVGIPTSLAVAFDEAAQDNLEAYVTASADNTLAAFRTDVSRWCAWAAENGVDPLKPAARAVRAFIKAHEQGRKPNTIKRMVANIGVLIDGIAGNANVTRTRIVKAEMKRIRREKGVAEEQTMAIRAKGAVMDLDEDAMPFSIARMIGALEPIGTLASARACFVLSLGGDTGRRCSEYRGATFADVTELPAGDGLLIIRRSKTDQDGEGLVKYASKRTMRLLKRWEAARQDAGEVLKAASPLLVSVDRWGHPGTAKLCTRGFNIMLRSAVRQALTIMLAEHPELHNQIEEIVEAVSSHSFRVGMVEDLTVAGESIVAICVEGGWQTPAMVVRYARNISAATGAGARLRKRLGDE